MADFTEITDIAIGLWRFKSSVDPQELCAVAREWIDERHPDEAYVDGINIRRSSRDELVMEFIVALNDGSKKTHEQYVYKKSDQLKRRFGNGLIGWDISSRAFMVSVPD